MRITNWTSNNPSNANVPCLNRKMLGSLLLSIATTADALFDRRQYGIVMRIDLAPQRIEPPRQSRGKSAQRFGLPATQQVESGPWPHRVQAQGSPVGTLHQSVQPLGLVAPEPCFERSQAPGKIIGSRHQQLGGDRRRGCPQIGDEIRMHPTDAMPVFKVARIERRPTFQFANQRAKTDSVDI